MSATRTQPQRPHPALTALTVLVAAVAVFVVAFLVSHQGARAAAPARIVPATLTPVSGAARQNVALRTPLGALAKPVLHKKKVVKKKTTTTPASSSSSSDSSSSSTYTPPVATYTPPASTYTPPAKSSTPKPSSDHGGEVVTIG